MKRSVCTFALAAITALGAAACDEPLSKIAGPTPNLEPTLSSIQREIFAQSDGSGRIACTGCHTDVGRTPASGLNLLDGQAYAALVNLPSRGRAGAVLVVPGNPDASYLLNKLKGVDIVGLRMPRGTTGPFLTDGQISIIQRWIELGAKND